ncbi:MAG: 30S ribosomal protein S1 [Proteobacteria bacterium]|nr:30S ribosomal protein S1 [Pseudomonadota bacterium]
MVEDLNETEENIQGSDDFMELYEESLKSIHEGKVIKGEIVQIDKEFVLVDIGYKSEGQIRIAEFVNLEGQLTAKVGAKVDVLLVRKEDRDGRIILSKEKAARVKIWDKVEEAYKNHDTVRGKIISRVKGGLSVDIGVQAFLPGSQADMRPVRDLGTLVGAEHDFRVIKYEKRQGNIVLSRRAALEAERKALREKTLELLEKDAILEGIVRNITDYGLFIDLGGIDGLVHITDMSWGKIGHPSEIYQIGDNITVKILSFDKERERVSLGIKQLTHDPWSGAQDKYPVGVSITGRIERLKEYGAFVEVEEGMEGLIHVSEISWTRKTKHPSQILSVGNIVEAKVLSLDIAKKRISLSIKQLEPNPWDTIAENYPIGAIIEGKIKNITDFGIFIGIDEGIDGLVHISDISWTKKINHPSELYKKDDEVQAVILDIDKENERFSLGIKQLTPDPWNEIPEKYKPGTRVSGTVTNVTDFGLFVELEEGIEGLIHVSQLPKGKQDNLLEGFQVKDEIQAEVVNVSKEDKRIGLSIRKLEESPERNIHKSYVNNQKQATSNIGNLLKEKMMDSQPQALLDSQESEFDEAAESESDIEIGPTESSSAKPQPEETNSV